jgi:hypothetical protein
MDEKKMRNKREIKEKQKRSKEKRKTTERQEKQRKDKHKAKDTNTNTHTHLRFLAACSTSMCPAWNISQAPAMYTTCDRWFRVMRGVRYISTLGFAA